MLSPPSEVGAGAARECRRPHLGRLLPDRLARAAPQGCHREDRTKADPKGDRSWHGGLRAVGQAGHVQHRDNERRSVNVPELRGRKPAIQGNDPARGFKRVPVGHGSHRSGVSSQDRRIRAGSIEAWEVQPVLRASRACRKKRDCLVARGMRSSANILEPGAPAHLLATGGPALARAHQLGGRTDAQVRHSITLFRDCPGAPMIRVQVWLHICRLLAIAPAVAEAGSTSDRSQWPHTGHSRPSPGS